MPGATVISVDPLDGEVGVSRNRPAIVRIQNAESHDYAVTETTQAHFGAGTLVTVVPTVSGTLILLPLGHYDTFESDAIGSVPAGWTRLAGATFTVESIDGQKAVKRTNGSDGWDYLRWEDGYQRTDFELTGDFRVASGNVDPRIRFRIDDDVEDTYELRFNAHGSEIYFMKIVAGGAETDIGARVAKTYTTNIWYSFRLLVEGTSLKARMWLRGASEPETWDLDRTDSSITAQGYIALAAWYSGDFWFDNLSLNGGSYNYEASGSRVSEAYSVASIDKFGAARIEWDAALPANTTLVIKISKNGSSWTTVESGDLIALWNEGDDLAGEVIFVKQELATSDISATPVLSEVRLVFRPVMPELVEVLVNGVSHTLANGGLDHWNTAKYSGGAIVDCYEDVYFATLLPWWDYGAETLDLVVNYNSVEKSATTFDTEQSESFWANGYAKWQANAIGGAYDGPMGGLAHYFVATIEPWLLRGEFHYNVQGAPIGAFDAYYYVAHVFAMDAPASGIVGEPCPSDTPASGIVEGWTPSDTPAAGIVQGWLRRDYPGSGVAGLRVVKDEAASGIAGRRVKTDTPASGVVYEVNANNTIELRVLSVEEAAALAALGISFE